MEARAKAKFIKGSARKVRQVADLVRGKKVEDALNILHFLRRDASTSIEKTLRSAVANAVGKAEDSKREEVEDMVVKEIYVDEGPTTKRIRPQAMGRAGRIRKRSSHITVVVGD